MNATEIAVVLVVDGDDVDRAAMVRALEEAKIPIRTIEAATVDEAVGHFAQEAPDCVVLDHGLPGVSDDRFIDIVHKQRAEAPVLVLTGFDDEKIAPRLMRTPVRDYFPKSGFDRSGFDRRGFARTVVEAIRLCRASRSTFRLEGRWRRQISLLGRLGVASPELFSTLSLEDLVNTATAAARSLFHAERAFLVLRPKGGATAQVSSVAEKRGSAMAGDVELPGGEAFWTTSDNAREAWKEPGPITPGAAPTQRLQAPVHRRDEVVGILGIDLVRDEHPDDDAADCAVLMQFGHMVSVALDNAYLYAATQEAVRAREETLTIVSHDLRAPLGSVRLAATLVEEVVPADPQLHMLLGRMESGITHMERLLEDLLDCSRIDAGKLVMTLAPTPVVQVVEAAFDRMAAPANGKKVTLQYDLGTPLPRALVDGSRTVQLLTNLLGNAIDHSQDGGLVTVRAWTGGNELVFEVRDDGEGFGDLDVTRLFDRFWQAGDRSKRGLGMGLYIARAIVEAHGGRIWVEPGGDTGARFRFTLPSHPGVQSPSIPAADTCRPENGCLGPGTSAHASVPAPGACSRARSRVRVPCSRHEL